MENKHFKLTEEMMREIQTNPDIPNFVEQLMFDYLRLKEELKALCNL